MDKKCEECKLYLDKRLKTPQMNYTGEGKLNALIIGEAPGYNEDKKNIQFIGKAGQLLRAFLSYLKCSLDIDFWKINALNCMPLNKFGNIREPSNKEIKLCRFKISDTIKKLKPKFIILMGRAALQSYFGEKESKFSINRWRRLCIPDYENNCWVLCLAHPSFALRRKDIRNTFFDDLKWAIEKIRANSDRPKTWDPKEKVHVLLDFDKIIFLLQNAPQNSTLLHFDYETTGLQPYKEGHKILTIGIAIDDMAYSFPFQYPNFWTKEQIEKIKDLWIKLLLNPQIKKVAHNLSFEEKWSRKILGVEIVNWHWCTMNVAHILDNREKYTSLDFQIFTKWGYRYGEEIKKYKKEDKDGFNTMDTCPIGDLCMYNGLDAFFGGLLSSKQHPEMDRDKKKAWEFYKKGCLALCDCEDTGMPVDIEYFKEEDMKLGKQIQRIEKKLLSSPQAEKFQKEQGHELKLRSNKDLPIFFYDTLGEDCKYKTPKDGRACNVKALNEMDNIHATALLRKRKLEKIKNPYIKSMLTKQIDGRIHSEFPLNIARTYRSSSFPFHQIPKRDDGAQRIIRSGIKPSKGNKILIVDYSGSEIKGMAIYSKDLTLIEYLKKGIDLHTDWARKIFFLSENDNPKSIFGSDLRYAAKNGWLFPMFYGSQYDIRAQAIWFEYIKNNTELQEHLKKNGILLYKDFIEHLNHLESVLWETFPGIKDYQERIKKFYSQNHYVKTYFGFKYTGYMDLNDLMNYPIQGTSFHWLLWSLIEINKLRRKEEWRTGIPLEIHDEILFDCFPSEEEMIREVGTRIMTQDIVGVHPWIIVPLEVEWKASEVDGNWSDMK